MSSSARWFSRLATVSLSFGVSVPAVAQTAAAEHDRWAETAESHVHDLLEQTGAVLAELHGPIAAEVDRLHVRMLPHPHGLEARASYPALPPMPGRVPASLALHHQAVHGGGDLGALHGPLAHPVGFAWFPHSMFAQYGGIYGQWGHARLLHAVHRHAAREDAGR